MSEQNPQQPSKQELRELLRQGMEDVVYQQIERAKRELIMHAEIRKALLGIEIGGLVSEEDEDDPVKDEDFIFDDDE